MALQTILHLLDSNQDGVLSEQEKAAAHIMLFGQSWGASAVVVLARELNLGNYRFDYKQLPIRCEGYTWFDRHITPDHMQSECDPHIWLQVENLMLERRDHPEPPAAAANPGP